MTLIMAKYLFDATQHMLLDIKKVPFKLQLKWNTPERASKNKSPTHSPCIDSVTFLSARCNNFANLLAKNLKTRRRFACLKSQRKARVAFL